MKTKILVVDDEPDTLLLMTRLLEPEGYEVITAHNGEESLIKVRNEHPRIVLLDILLPGIDGYEVCQKIKSDETLCTIIVILFTVKIFDTDRERGFQAGADYYMIKPFSWTSLLALIKNILGE
jgi:two-component system alkaline phosphatase synthesis response regulator PhoP